jgi:hypothetical protein
LSSAFFENSWKSILSAHSATTALSGAECAGNSLGLWGKVAPVAQLEGLRPSRPPLKAVLLCVLSGFIPSDLPESCTAVCFPALFLQTSPESCTAVCFPALYNSALKKYKKISPNTCHLYEKMV